MPECVRVCTRGFICMQSILLRASGNSPASHRRPKIMVTRLRDIEIDTVCVRAGDQGSCAVYGRCTNYNIL